MGCNNKDNFAKQLDEIETKVYNLEDKYQKNYFLRSELIKNGVRCTQDDGFADKQRIIEDEKRSLWNKLRAMCFIARDEYGIWHKNKITD